MCIMFKKILAALLVAGTVLTLAACDKDDQKQPDTKTPDNQVETPGTTDNSTTEEGKIDYDAVLSKEKYDGYTYPYACAQGTGKEPVF